MAAVAGRRLDLTLLQTIAPNISLSWGLNVCAEAMVLEVSDDQWRFSHDKLREGLLSRLSPDECQRLHRRVAEAIEQVYPEQNEYAATLAHH